MVKNFNYYQPTRTILGMGKGAKLAIKEEVNKEPIEKALPIIGVPTTAEMGMHASRVSVLKNTKEKSI